MQNLPYVGKRFPKIFGENEEKVDTEISYETNESRKLLFFFLSCEWTDNSCEKLALGVLCYSFRILSSAGHGRTMLSVGESLFLSFAWGSVLRAVDHTNAHSGGAC